LQSFCGITMNDTKVDYTDELAKIDEEIKSLVTKIELSTQCKENEPNDSIKWFRSHCELQHELGLAWHRQAQLEEEARIAKVRHDAVESGLVVTPRTLLNMGECPLCLCDIPDPNVDDYETFRRNVCCAVACCIDCVNQHVRAVNAAIDARHEARPGRVPGATRRVPESAQMSVLSNRRPYERGTVSPSNIGSRRGWQSLGSS
jgi:hypothetical protein